MGLGEVRGRANMICVPVSLSVYMCVCPCACVHVYMCVLKGLVVE